MFITPDNKVHEAKPGPTWVLSAQDGPHVGPMNLAIRDIGGLTMVISNAADSSGICVRIMYATGYQKEPCLSA